MKKVYLLCQYDQPQRDVVSDVYATREAAQAEIDLMSTSVDTSDWVIEDREVKVPFEPTPDELIGQSAMLRLEEALWKYFSEQGITYLDSNISDILNIVRSNPKGFAYFCSLYPPVTQD